MIVTLTAWHAKKHLATRVMEVESLRRIKGAIKRNGAWTTEVDVYFGPAPVRESARVRRVNGYWNWRGLELSARDAGLCRV